MIKPISLSIDPIPDSPLPISLSDLKAQLRVSGSDEDGLIQGYLFAALHTAENVTHRTIVSREHRWTLRDFPCSIRQDIRLPRGKTQSVSSIQYTSGGTTATLTGPSSGSPAGTDYQEDLEGDDGGIIMPNQGASWPSVDLDVPSPVVITFTAGWASGDIPQDVIHAVMLLVGHWFQNREASVVAASVAELPMGAEALLSGYRLSRWY